MTSQKPWHKTSTALDLTWSGAALALCVLLVAFLVLQVHIATRRPKNFPPGPRGLPLLGNLASIPLVKSYVTFAEWTKQYGPIVGLKAGPLNLVVLQDPADIRELYDRRGHLYAGRPFNYIALNHVWDPEVGQILLFQRNDRLLKRWKRPARWFLSQQGIDSLGPIIDAMSSRCVKGLVDRPGDFTELLRVWALSTPLVALSGQADISPGLLRTYFYRQKLLTGLLEPGRTPPVDFIIPLRWVPARWAKWKRDAKFVREHQDSFYGELVARAKAARDRRREGGMAGEYVCVMERLMDEDMSDNELKWLSGGLLDAAFDTSSAAVLNFVVAMAAHPDVLAKAREEMEDVLQGKVPSVEDVAKLPYLKACLMEMLRWRPSTPLGLPHVAESDDTYKGYVIPQGTNIVVNAYGLLHDPATHRDPDRFDPSRYADPEAHTDEKLRSTWVFGAGRRKCLGEQYTVQALLTVVAKAVWALDMSVPAGTDLSVEGGFEGGLMMKPREGLVVQMKVREGRAVAVERDCERGEAELRRLLGKKV